MKKGLLITVDFWPRTGGVATFYTTLLNHVKRFQSVVLTTPMEDVSHRLSQIKPQTLVIRRPFLYRFFWPRWARLVFQLWRLSLTQKPDFYLVGDILPVGSAVWLLQKFIRKPFIVFIHGTDIISAQTSIKKRHLSKGILNASELIIVNTNFSKEVVKKLGIVDEKIEVLYPCAPKISFHDYTLCESLQDRYDLYNKKVILSISRLVARKGIQYVLEAIKHLREKKFNIVYVVIGDGPLFKTLTEKSQFLGLAGNVLFFRALKDHEKHAWLAISDLFVLTPFQLKNGDYEGFGIVYLEAAHFELPVISSKTGGIPEAVVDNQTGLLVDNPSDTKKLADTIERLLTEESFSHLLGVQAKRRVRELFDCQKQAQRFEDILQRRNFL